MGCVDILQWKRQKRTAHVVNIKKESNRNWILFSLNKENIENFNSLSFPRKGASIVILHTPNGSNIRIGLKLTKQYSNSPPITKIYFQIIFEFTWYATSAFTVMELFVSRFQMQLAVRAESTRYSPPKTTKHLFSTISGLARLGQVQTISYLEAFEAMPCGRKRQIHFHKMNLLRMIELGLTIISVRFSE